MDQKVLTNVMLRICHLGTEIGIELTSNKHEGMVRQGILTALPSYIHTSCALTFWK